MGEPKSVWFWLLWLWTGVWVIVWVLIGAWWWGVNLMEFWSFWLLVWVWLGAWILIGEEVEKWAERGEDWEKSLEVKKKKGAGL